MCSAPFLKVYTRLLGKTLHVLLSEQKDLQPFRVGTHINCSNLLGKNFILLSEQKDLHPFLENECAGSHSTGLSQ